jgi:hypothetical protein
MIARIISIDNATSFQFQLARFSALSAVLKVEKVRPLILEYSGGFVA